MKSFKCKKAFKQCNMLIAGLIFLLFLPVTNAKSDVSKHHQIMAGFLLHFTSFTTWPEQNGDTINVCILGDDKFKQYLNAMVKRRPNNAAGQSIVISRSKKILTASVSACQIIYADPKQLPKLWQVLPAQHKILLVSHSKEFIGQGGMINFVRDHNKVKLEVNLPAVTDAGLKLSSALLKHSMVITDQPSRPNGSEEKE